ncbi:chemotaxis protein CheW [Candidatus Venteria ishoeyi]|uniref:CheW-like domain protein n=1 Tax=Candidatus Venteria ishoeyi TaxID=1899563 RepID=A0A1H6FAY7_9GAMM|nr:chemotaxis protein CheW [Candidatus Venteria ishoeyi]MDM8547192.1 chemotaxis protein CheW [Candidatus Venteria ishoeyi]SEH06541.1 CheW-like domain protein [Candidatus Venteria ishoeyi]
MKNKRLRPTEVLGRKFIYPEASEHKAQQEVIFRRLGFKIGDIGLLIAENTVSELVEMGSICSLPNTAEWLTGLVNLRGNLIPVFELGVLLNLDLVQGKKRMLLVLGQGEAAAALPISELPSQQRFHESDKMENLPALPDALTAYAPSGYEQNDEIWFNFEHEAFFESLAGKIAS